MDHSHHINGSMVLSCKFKHIKCGVPAGCHILRHHTRGKAVSGECLVPGWQKDGC